MGILDELAPAPKKPRPNALTAEAGALVVGWDDGRIDRLPMLFLRARCPCAGCVDEWSGKRLLNVTTLKTDVGVARMSEVGRYAVQVAWTDGHESGIYSWDLLRRLGDEHAKGEKT